MPLSPALVSKLQELERLLKALPHSLPLTDKYDDLEIDLELVEQEESWWPAVSKRLETCFKSYMSRGPLVIDARSSSFTDGRLIGLLRDTEWKEHEECLVLCWTDKLIEAALSAR